MRLDVSLMKLRQRLCHQSILMICMMQGSLAAREKIEVVRMRLAYQPPLPLPPFLVCPSIHLCNTVCAQTKAIFGDGSTFECDVIVACTGYKNTFPFVEKTHPDINEYGQNPRLLYKQVGLSVPFFFLERTRLVETPLTPSFAQTPRLICLQAVFI